MRNAWVLAFGCVGIGCAAPAGLTEPRSYPFTDDAVAGPAAGFIVPATPAGPAAGLWQVVEDASAPSLAKVLKQVSPEFTGAHYNVCVAGTPAVADFTATVAIRCHPEAKAADPEDRGGGLVFRYQDVKNYYVCRWNPLENNFRVYTVVDGTRTQVQGAPVPGPADDARWHVMSVTAVGAAFTCRFDDVAEVKLEDARFAQGQIGCWTKADAVTAFDDLTITPAAPK